MKLDERVKELIAVGASVAVNCQPCLQYHVAKAREAGAEDEEVSVAIGMAKAVRKGAAAKMDDFTAGLRTASEPVEESAGRGCGCTC